MAAGAGRQTYKRNDSNCRNSGRISTRSQGSLAVCTTHSSSSKQQPWEPTNHNSSNTHTHTEIESEKAKKEKGDERGLKERRGNLGKCIYG